MKPARFLPVLLAFCMFSTGASGLVNEYVLATITTYILGNSIEQFSVVIAVMMLMMGVSGFVQNRMSDRALLQKFVLVEVLMALLGGFAPLVIYAAFGYLEDHFKLVHYFFVCSIGFLIGFEIPLVMRIIDQHNIRLRTNLALVYAMDYVGAFVGAVIWVKVLLRNFPLTEISFIVAGFNFLVATVTIVYFLARGVMARAWTLGGVLAGTAALMLIGVTQNRDLSALLEQRFYQDPIVLTHTSRYQHLVLTENPYNGDIRLYINGNTQFSSLDEARYHDLLVHPALAAASGARKVLVIGGGDGLALREILRYPRIEQVTLVDLDPDMVRLASTHPLLTRLNENAFANARVHATAAPLQFGAMRQGVYLERRKNGRVTETQWVASVDVVNIDADQFLRSPPAGALWDVVIIDLPDPSSIELTKLYSREFYRALKRVLAPGAFVAVQSTSPIHARPAFLAIGSTLRSAGYRALPYRQNVPSFGDWGFYLAWTGKAKPEEIRRRLSSLTAFEVETRFLTPDVLAASFAFGKGELDTGSRCINTLMEPCLLYAYVDQSWVNE